MGMPGEWEDDQYSKVLLKFFCVVPTQDTKRCMAKHQNPPEEPYIGLRSRKNTEMPTGNKAGQLQLQELWFLYVLLPMKWERTFV